MKRLLIITLISAAVIIGVFSIPLLFCERKIHPTEEEINYLVSARGLEPQFTESKSVVLPIRRSGSFTQTSPQYTLSA